MAQLWLNLPASQKMAAPNYQPLAAKDIPTVPLFRVPAVTPAAAGTAEATAPAAPACAADGLVRLVAGSLGGVAGAAQTASPVELWDATLEVTPPRRGPGRPQTQGRSRNPS
jgi:hypothetical protein